MAHDTRSASTASLSRGVAPRVKVDLALRLEQVEQMPAMDMRQARAMSIEIADWCVGVSRQG